MIDDIYLPRYPHPILKWAGGKTSLLNTFEKEGFIPENFETYYEPFFGAGALYFYLWKSNRIEKAVLSDINVELYNLYNIIKLDHDKIINCSYKIDMSPDEKTYYMNRKKFNKLKQKPLNSCDENQKIKRALLLLYLNKTGYSGMYRENSNGEYNVPCGNYKNPTIVDEKNLQMMHDALECATILGTDFRTSIENAKNNDFIYFDPPYKPHENISKFRDYHRIKFGDNEQMELRNTFRAMNEKGCKLMLSNSSSPDLNEMYESIPNISIKSVYATRLINQKNIGRQIVEEYVITNYTPTPYY